MVDEPANPPGLAGHLKDALIGAHDHLAEAIDGRKKAHVANVLEQFEADLGPLLAPMIDQALGNPSMPDEWKPLLREAAAPEHFSGSLLIGVAVGAIIGPVLGSAVEPYVNSISVDAWVNNPSRPITPEVAVASALKGVTGPFDPAGEALQSGINRDRFAQMVEAAGNALGFEQALELQRRGLLVGVTLEDVLRYSNVNPRFYASALNLVTNPVGIGEVLNARIRSHLDDGTARNLYAQAGGIPGQYQWRLDSTGRPPGPMQVLELWNRGIITEATVDAMLAQSDLALQFQSSIKALRQYLPPPRSIVPMLRSKAITETQARELLGNYGVQEPWATAFVKEAQTSSTSAAKTLTQAQVTASYETKLIPRAAALARLEAVGYDAADANQILDLADEKRQMAMADATQRLIGSRYITRKITKPQAVTQLNAIPIPSAAQVDLFHLWDIELAITVHHLTPAQVIGGYRRGQISAAQCKTRLLALGVETADLGIIVADGFPPTKPAAAQAAADAVVNA